MESINKLSKRMSNLYVPYTNTTSIFNSALRDIFDGFSGITLDFIKLPHYEQMILIESYLVHHQYSYTEVMDVLRRPYYISLIFKNVFDYEHLFLPDDYTDEISNQFICFIANNFDNPWEIFEEDFIYKVRDVCNKQFDYFKFQIKRGEEWGVPYYDKEWSYEESELRDY